MGSGIYQQCVWRWLTDSAVVTARQQVSLELRLLKPSRLVGDGHGEWWCKSCLRCSLTTIMKQRVMVTIDKCNFWYLVWILASQKVGKWKRCPSASEYPKQRNGCVKSIGWTHQSNGDQSYGRLLLFFWGWKTVGMLIYNKTSWEKTRTTLICLLLHSSSNSGAVRHTYYVLGSPAIKLRLNLAYDLHMGVGTLYVRHAGAKQFDLLKPGYFFSFIKKPHWFWLIKVARENRNSC